MDNKNFTYFSDVRVKWIPAKVGVDGVVGVDAIHSSGDGTDQPRRLQLHTRIKVRKGNY
jgi:hypothetical protein